MNANEYKEKVIELFKSGKATERMWEEMSEAVLNASEDDELNVYAIDCMIYGKRSLESN